MHKLLLAQKLPESKALLRNSGANKDFLQLQRAFAMKNLTQNYLKSKPLTVPPVRLSMHILH